MPVALHAPRRPYVLYGLLAFLFLISATYRVLEVGELIGELRYGDEFVRAPFTAQLPRYHLAAVEDEASRAGLRPGDQVTRIDGRRVHYTAPDLWVPLRAARAGDRLAVEATRVENGSPSTLNASIVLQPLRSGAPSAADVISFAIRSVLMPIVCTALGFWVAAVRIRDGRAWLLLILMLGFVEFFAVGFRSHFGRTDFFQPIAAAYQPILANFWAAALLLFAISFPERLRVDRRVPWVKWLAIAPIAIYLLGEFPLFGYVARRNPEAALGLATVLDPLRSYFAATYPLFMVGCFVIMGYRTLTERRPDARRRLLLLDAGAVVSLVPVLIVAVLVFTGRREIVLGWLASPILEPVFLGLVALFPLTMAYVIVVHRAMDVRVVVRQGIQYVLARGGIRVIQLALIVAVTLVAASLLSGGAEIGRVLIVVAGLAAIVAIGGRFADRLRNWVDRRFFREAYDAEQILSELAMQVRTMVETRPLLQTVVQRVSETLHVPRVAILLNEGGRLAPAYAVGYVNMPEVDIPEESITVRRLQRDSHATVRFDDRNSWVHDLADDERHSLETLHPDVLLPLSLNRKVLGVLSLGPKRSEEPYSSSDLRMLGSVATQTGLALENSRLTAAITAQIAEREKRQRELEIAREVQQRLFPQTYPSVPGLEYAGACRPALEVGGDYYDFVTLSPTELGIAVGDVSGKGIPAALLMATLRAFLRGQTIGGEKDLAAMMLNLNALVYESSATNRYATFFFGRYNAATCVLDYVNAGHNPPMVFRACARGASDVVRLDTGGPVIGLLPQCSYEQGSVALKTGDVLVTFTDGISEAMNVEDEEFGEERLIAAVGPAQNLAPAALIAHIMAAADAFAGSAPQHDDMTLVVARCT